jgi:hypothetical protein
MRSYMQDKFASLIANCCVHNLLVSLLGSFSSWFISLYVHNFIK